MVSERVLLDSSEGAKWLPFARSQLRRLRMVGMDLVRTYAVDGALIKVEIHGSYNKITVLAESGPYLVAPASLLNPQPSMDGPFDERALMTATGQKWKVQEDQNPKTGPHDWHDKKGKQVVTYNHGGDMRYYMHGMRYGVYASRHLYVDGHELRTENPVHGAGRSDQGVLLYANLGGAEDGEAGLLSVYSYDESDGRELLLDSYAMDTQKMLITQPVVFSASGKQLLTVVESLGPVGLGGERKRLPPFFFLLGHLREEEGQTLVDFELRPIAQNHYREFRTGIYTEYSGTPGAQTVVVQNLPLMVPYSFSDPPCALPYDQTSKSSEGELGNSVFQSYRWARDVKDGSSYQIIGVDFDKDEEPVLVERIVIDKVYAETRSDTLNTRTAGGVSYEFTGPYYWEGKGQYYDVCRASTQTTSLDVNTDTGSVVQELHKTIFIGNQVALDVGGKEIDELITTTVNSTSSEYSDTHYGTGGWGLSPDGSTSKTTTTETRYKDERESFGLRHIDARDQSLTLVRVKEQKPNKTAETAQFVVSVVAMVGEETFSKSCYEGEAPTLAHGVASSPFYPMSLCEDLGYSRPHASRKRGEYLICASASSRIAPEDGEGGIDALDYLANHQETYGGMLDRDPLLLGKTKAEKIGTELNKELFSLGKEEQFRMDPIYLL